MFLRDAAHGDLVGFIDDCLGENDDGRTQAGRATSLIEPFRNVIGVSDKVLSMAFADMLMAAPDGKQHWIEIGASMIAVDTLVHNFLERTGSIRLGTRHRYGPACYQPNGCADIIEKVAKRLSRRTVNPVRTTPRILQFKIWFYCSQQGYAVCNGMTVDDNRRCTHRPCSLYCQCDRIRLLR
jgi:hypothetical protein